jgi:hypothetical protein
VQFAHAETAVTGRFTDRIERFGDQQVFVTRNEVTGCE